MATCEEHYSCKKRNFSLTNATKKKCVETLCSDIRASPYVNHFSTCTSDWVRSKGMSYCAYTLLKVKRWHLTDENFLFDPLKKCPKKIELLPANTLWRTFHSPHEASEQPCELESALSIDGILAGSLLKKKMKGKVGKALTELDNMLEALDKAHEVDDAYDADKLFQDLDISDLQHGSFSKVYDDFIHVVSHAICLNAMGATLPEKSCEEVFKLLVHCLMESIGGETLQQVCCNQNVDGSVLEKSVLPVELKDGVLEKLSLEIRSKPDLFLYYRKTRGITKPKTVIAVVEAKGLRKSRVTNSDDENEQEVAYLNPTVSEWKRPSLDALAEEEEDDDDEGPEETDLERLIDTSCGWLGSVRNLPPVIEKFLPQLIGQMWCAARSKNLRPLKTNNGLLFGIGVIGFDVYFVTMLDSCRGTPEVVVNVDTAFTNIFITRPLNILMKKDRRTILKILAASFTLPESIKGLISP